MAPTEAATLYRAPIQENSAAASYPSIRSEWFAGSNNFPRNVRTFDRCNGGWFGICFLFGTTTHYYWRGTFAFVPKLDAPFTSQPALAFAERRWLDGAEWPNAGESGSGNQKPNVSRAASRHLQGYGYKFDSTALQVTHDPVESGLAATSSGSGNAFIFACGAMTPRQVPIWRTGGATSPLAGVGTRGDADRAARTDEHHERRHADDQALRPSRSRSGCGRRSIILYTYGTSGYCRT
jgi:hypothetical protein